MLPSLMIAKLLSRHYSISSAINVNLTYDNGDTSINKFRIGDEVSISYNSGRIEKLTGIIKDVIVRKELCSNSFKYNEKVSNSSYDVQFKIDTSITEVENIITINFKQIIDMILGDNIDILHIDGLNSKKYNIKYNVNVKFTYDNKFSYSTNLKVGDEVTIARYLDSDKTKLDKVSGIIFDIINKKEEMTTSFSSNEKSGNGGYDLLFRIDTNYLNPSSSFMKDIYFIEFEDLAMGSDDDNDPYPPIDYRDPEHITEDPIDPNIQYKIRTTSDIGKILDTELTVNKNEDAKIKISYDNYKQRLSEIKINGKTYKYDKTKGTYYPELPINIGVTEKLPTAVNMLQLYSDVENEGIYDLSFDFVDKEDQEKVLSMFVLTYVDGSIEIDLLNVQQNYDIEVKFGPNNF